MNAQKTYTFMVRCKCSGSAGAARVEVNYTADRLAFDFFDYTRAHQNPTTACWSCRRFFKIEDLRAVRTAHVCGAKCLTSKGPSCECSCGGRNHGIGLAA